MLDYLASKMVWIVAALILTATVISVFTWQRDSLEELELEKEAENITDLINQLSKSESEFTRSISFGYDKAGDFHFGLDTTKGNPILNFTSRGIFLEVESRRIWSPFLSNIYLYSPYFLNDTSESTLNRINDEAGSIVIKGNSYLTIESKKVRNDHLLFLYKLENSTTLARTSDIGEEIIDSLSWNFTSPERTTQLSIDQAMVLKDNFFYLIDNNSSFTPFHLNDVNLFQPDFYEVTSERMKKLKDKNSSLYVLKNQQITVETKVINIDGEEMVLRFIYHSSI